MFCFGKAHATHCRVRLSALIAVIAISGFGSVGPAVAQVVEFSVPGSDQTVPTAINDTGWIAGNAGNGGTSEGFLRAPDGAITTFQVSGAESVSVSGINTSGVIAGTTLGPDVTDEGFVRSVDGTITSFEVANSFETYVNAINDSGMTTGIYENANHFHGFVRAADGSVTTFDVSGADTTYPTSINSKGEIAGFYGDAKGSHGFFRRPNGRIVTFDAPSCSSVYVSGMNSSGDIIGFCHEDTSFIRLKNGSLTILSKKHKTIAAIAINDARTVVGFLDRRENKLHGFIKSFRGRITAFKVPEKKRETYLNAINDGGVAIGWSQSDEQTLGIVYMPAK